jgi:hypothetical protein
MKKADIMAMIPPRGGPRSELGLRISKTKLGDHFVTSSNISTVHSLATYYKRHISYRTRHPGTCELKGCIAKGTHTHVWIIGEKK